MLQLQDIAWSAPDGERILKGVSLTVPDDTLMVITGPNGGGKTTLAKVIAGLERPESGRILLDGEDITDLNVTERAKRGVSYAFQQPVRFKGLVVRQLLELAAGEKLSEAKLCDVLSQVGLCAREYIDREVNATLSGGEIKRIEIATVLLRHSRLSIFDEPEAGIDLWSFNNLIDRVPEPAQHAARLHGHHLPSGAHFADRRRDRRHFRRGTDPSGQGGGDIAGTDARRGRGRLLPPEGGVCAMSNILEGLLKAVSDWNGKFTGAFNIRENGECAGRQSTKNIRIESKTDKPGLDIRIRPGTKGETVSIPACVTHGGVDDLVYNDFFVGEGADVTIVAGCGVHTDSEELARHNGIHRFFLAKGARVTYLEKHVGTGKGEGVRSIDPVTEMFLEEDAVMTMDTSQIGGVDKSAAQDQRHVGRGREAAHPRAHTHRGRAAGAHRVRGAHERRGFRHGPHLPLRGAGQLPPVLPLGAHRQRPLHGAFGVRRHHRRPRRGRRGPGAVRQRRRRRPHPRGRHRQDCRRTNSQIADAGPDRTGGRGQDHRRFPALKKEGTPVKPPVLLTYNLHGERAAKIRMAAMRFRVRLRAVERREYARPLAELVENGPEGDWAGEAFDEEMLVMAHFPPALVQAFLQGLRRAGVRPGGLKAVLTPTNAQWDSLALYTELCREREAISQGAASVHGQTDEGKA